MEEQKSLQPHTDKPHNDGAVKGMYKDWFLDYASYVILERAVPAVNDGLKPVQRRILHSMKEMDDGRFNKVANVIGNTMKYHPHGDAAIGDAIVNLGQKDLLIETQGNWGDVRTGDRAAAPRYIEARLSKFALDVAFNVETTDWQLSYDGRNKEPITLPMKFPLLLAQGVEGIAVGLSTKIMPHNFNELIDASVKYLQGRGFKLLPDFLTGGNMEVTDYNDGKRGGKIRLRATIEELDKKTLVITEIPYGTTTSSIIDSIIKANDRGKIKIKKVVDNTAEKLEIEVYFPSNIDIYKAKDALYAFTDCEVSISPNACIIVEDKPHFIGVSDVLKYNTDQTVALLKLELQIKLKALKEKWHFSSLEKIFIENRIYRDIEEAETFEQIIDFIFKGLEPFKKQLKREISRDDLIKLTEIKIKRISKYDAFKADEFIKNLENEINEAENHLAHLIDFAIQYFHSLKKKFGKGRERKTKITEMENIKATKVAMANEKLYINRAEGFIGYGIKKAEFISDCSDIDNIIVFREDGSYVISKVSEKAWFGKNIIHVEVWRKNNSRLIYNVAYRDGETGISFVKRFNVNSITRDKEYNLGQGSKNSKVLYLSSNPNGEAEVVSVYLHHTSKARVKNFEYDFSVLDVKGRASRGNILSKHKVRKVELKKAGVSTLGDRKVYYDQSTGRLYFEERGVKIGSFQGDDMILAIYKSGSYELFFPSEIRQFKPEELIGLYKFVPSGVLTAVYKDGKTKNVMIKRFLIETLSTDQKFVFIRDEKGSKLLFANYNRKTTLEVISSKENGQKIVQKIEPSKFIEVKGWKSIGNKLTNEKFNKLTVLKDEEILKNENEQEPEESSEQSLKETDTEGNPSQIKLL